jgi:hypothetical protein
MSNTKDEYMDYRVSYPEVHVTPVYEGCHTEVDIPICQYVY